MARDLAWFHRVDELAVTALLVAEQPSVALDQLQRSRIFMGAVLGFRGVMWRSGTAPEGAFVFLECMVRSGTELLNQILNDDAYWWYCSKA
jgi:hypothetical protein